MSMTRLHTLKAQTSAISVVFLFMIILMLSMYMFSLNVISDTSVDHTTETELSYQADQIRLQASITNLMADKMWRAESIEYGDYGGQPAYVVISRFLSSEPNDKLWIDGNSISYADAEDDVKAYISHKMNSAYGNTKYRVELSDESDSVLTVGERIADPAVTSFPVATNSGNQGTITIQTEGGGSLHVR